MRRKQAKIPVEVSARHVHLSARDVEKLFGKGVKLHKSRAVSQSKQFLSKERVTLSNSFFTLSDVGIVGPEREKTQVELSATDARAFSLKIPVLESGKLRGSKGGLTIHGPNGSVALRSGIIVAKRHVHISLSEAKHFGVADTQRVSVRIQNPDDTRALTFHDVVVRAHRDFRLVLHLDTDEGNAAGVTSGSVAVFVTE